MSPGKPGTNKKILLVDDDKDFLESNRLLLESEGYKIITALDGSGAMAAAEKERPDLIVMDVMMNYDTEGFDISRKISQASELQHIPVIIITGMRSLLHVPLGISSDKSWLPVSVVLEKPIDPQKFLAEIKKQLEQQPRKK